VAVYSGARPRTPFLPQRSRVVDVPTLSLPEAARPPLAEALLSDAVALFVERAQPPTHGRVEYFDASLPGLALRIAPVSREMVLNYVAQHSLDLPRSYGAKK
jgi:hypothetical protein